jgi:SLOG family YspA-like protein
VCEAIKASGFQITCVLSGCANGVDRLGESWANDHGIPVRRYPAKWETLGKEAGVIRNSEMVEDGEQAICIWDGRSPGTRDLIQKAKHKPMRVYVHKVGDF